MLSNEYLHTKIGFDTAESEPSKVWPVCTLPRTLLGQRNSHVHRSSRRSVRTAIRPRLPRFSRRRRFRVVPHPQNALRSKKPATAEQNPVPEEKQRTSVRFESCDQVSEISGKNCRRINDRRQHTFFPLVLPFSAPLGQMNSYGNVTQVTPGRNADIRKKQIRPCFRARSLVFLFVLSQTCMIPTFLLRSTETFCLPLYHLDREPDRND